MKVTSSNWGLEEVLFRPHNSTFAAVVSGPGKLSTWQTSSSVLFAAIVNILPVIAFVSFIVWAISDIAGSKIHFLWLLIPMYLILSVPFWTRLHSLYFFAKHFKKVEHDTEERSSHEKNSVAITEQEEIYRVTKLTQLGAWLIFSIEVFFLYIIPVANLFRIGNNGVGWLFVCVGLVVGLRHYGNPAIALEEFGRLSNIIGALRTNEPDRSWQSQSRLHIIGTHLHVF